MQDRQAAAEIEQPDCRRRMILEVYIEPVRRPGAARVELHRWTQRKATGNRNVEHASEKHMVSVEVVAQQWADRRRWHADAGSPPPGAPLRRRRSRGNDRQSQPEGEPSLQSRFHTISS